MPSKNRHGEHYDQVCPPPYQPRTRSAEMVVAKWFPQFIPNKVLAKDPINEVQRVTWNADNWSWHWNDKNSGCYRLALTKNGWKLWQSIVVRNGTVYGASAKDWSIEATELHQLKAKFAAYRLAGKELCEE